uniref:Polygalacturonase n=1 Tax=Mangifera indica TaxID=29780 RepID=A0A514YDF7_MANIN|nr:polygalacturonase [Mangifera indica]
MSYGAKPDGKTDSTQAFLEAWSWACKSANPAMIYIPEGTFFIGAAVFEGPCTSRIGFKIDGTIMAPSNYWKLGDSGHWILFSKVSGISIQGGIIDAKGSDFWECRRGGQNCPAGARSIAFSWSRNIVLNGLRSINSQIFHVALNHCNNVSIKNVQITAPEDSPNTDGIHMQASTGVTISSSNIATGDDCVSIGQGSKNVWIERVSCGPGHGISIGSLGDDKNEDGVEDITVTNSVFTETQNGVRIKSFPRESNGYAKNIIFKNLTMNNVHNPIIIDQNYCPDHKGCQQQNSGVTISGVTYSNIKGTSATAVAMKFDCLSGSPCSGIKLEDINLSYKGKSSSSYCKNAHGGGSGTVIPRSCL